mmetsp:Transcript_26265/g.42054  ORF Transcript_26265/g.42054 Transcript_26265/m.42054 type:complete len:225 (+) Transcript_26265:131-805(+)
MSGLFGMYMSALKKRPLPVKTATGCFAACVGDVIAQKVQSGGEEPLDMRRLMAFTLYGAVWTGPVNHVWLARLERWFPAAGGRQNLAKKVFVQQFVWSPIVYLPSFFVANNLLRGRSIEEMKEDMRKRYWATYISCVVFWVPTNSILFARVPEVLQSVTMAGINCVWNSMLSFIANSHFFADLFHGEEHVPPALAPSQHDPLIPASHVQRMRPDEFSGLRTEEV